MPVRPPIAGTTYRRLRFGKLADLHLLDLRSFRSQQVSVGNGTVDDPDRTITGRAQLDWLKAGLSRSDTTWRLVGNSVMISPFAFGSLPADLLKPLAELLGLPQEGLAPQHRPVGRLHRRPPRAARPPARERHPQHRLPHRRHPHGLGQRRAGGRRDLPAVGLGRHRVRGHLGDLRQPRRHPEGPRGHASPRSPSPLIQAANRHVHWVDTDRHGYGVLDITAERAQMDYYVLSDRTKRQRDLVLAALLPHPHRHPEGRADVHPRLERV